ncbi:YfkD family protein [Terrilactibacillus laevilacticus]|uniref:YfkD family protein n=1 Tax=Terrilactibacillus laevilacticus TaxID=1380157 RepID=A0ABW5PUR9_9BACI|nr:YfkD family protein [Terrilactibacillus laevilacticus]
MKQLILALGLCLLFTPATLAKEGHHPKQQNFQTPNFAVDISKENTYPNPDQSAPELQPSPLTKGLLKTSKVKIENPMLIKYLNESTIHPSKFSIGYHAHIYLGKWALSYKSSKVSINWEYKKINDSSLDARGSEGQQEFKYTQESNVKVTGGLTAKVPNQEGVKGLMMTNAAKKTDLPLAFSTVVGKGTKIDRLYHVQPKKMAHLYGYVPAVNEKGTIFYGEVFLVLKGGKKWIEVKNVEQQGIGAWIPIQDHVSLRYVSN